MKNIAIVFDGLGIGGIERVGIDYVKLCIELGYSVDVYNLNPAFNELKTALPIERVRYFEFKLSRKDCPETYSYGIQKWWWGKYAYAIISPLLSLKQCLQKYKFKNNQYDVAIAFSGHINDLSFVTKNYIISSKKICWCHGSLISYLAICDAYSILYRKVDCLITLSAVGQKDVYGGKKFLHEKNIVKMYNPTYIRDKKLDQNKIEKLNSLYGNYILMTARFENGKGQNIAIDAVKSLGERGIHPKILFAGEGRELQNIKEYALKQGIEEQCVFLGNCHDIQNYIYASYVNLLTSLWEGLPTVIVEAMMFGKPCVMTNSDDGEVSQGGRYCVLENINDYGAIADDLYMLYSDKSVYDRYSRLSLQRANDFKPEVIKTQLQSVLEKL